jgi:hypothetical protein
MSDLMIGGKKQKKQTKKVKQPKDKKTSKTKKENPWLTHVKKTMKEYPDKDFKDILVIAKKSYKKK